MPASVEGVKPSSPAVSAATDNATARLSPGATKTDIEKAVTDAALRRWDLMLAEKYAAAFAYFTDTSQAGIEAGFLRNYINNLGAKKVVVKTTKCSENVCDVEFDLTIAVKIPNIPNRLIDVPLKERWIVHNGEPKIVRPSAR